MLNIFKIGGTIFVDDKQAKRAITGIDRIARNTTKTFQNMDKTIQKISKIGSVFGKIAVGFGGFMLLKKGINDVTKAAFAQERAEARLRTTMLNVNGTTEEQVEKVKQLSKEYQELLNVGDEVSMMGASQLATFQLTSKSIEKLYPSMLDLGAGMYGVKVNQQQMINVGNLMGKVMMGQVGALTRVGVSLTDLQAELIKTGDEEQRVAVLTEVINSNFGGLAKSLGETREGELQRFHNKLGDLKEQIGLVVGIVIDKALPVINKVIDGVSWLVGLMTQQKKTIADLAEEYKNLSEKENLSVKEKERLKELTKILAEEFPDIIQGIDDESDSLKINTEELIKNVRARNLLDMSNQAQERINGLEKEISILEQRNRLLAESLELKPQDIQAFNKMKAELLIQLFDVGLDVKEIFDIESLKDVDKLTVNDFLEAQALPEVQDAIDQLGERYQKVLMPLINFKENQSGAKSEIEENLKSIAQLNGELDYQAELLGNVNAVLEGNLSFDQFNEWVEVTNAVTEATQETENAISDLAKSASDMYSEEGMKAYREGQIEAARITQRTLKLRKGLAEQEQRALEGMAQGRLQISKEMMAKLAEMELEKTEREKKSLELQAELYKQYRFGQIQAAKETQAILAQDEQEYIDKQVNYWSQYQDQVTKELIEEAKKRTEARQKEIEEWRGVLDEARSFIDTFINDTTNSIAEGTFTWSGFFKSFGDSIGGIFNLISQKIISAFLDTIIAQNTWLATTLANIATAISAYLSQAYAALVAFFWFLGPGAPFAAGAVIAGAIAAIAGLAGLVIGSITGGGGNSGGVTPPSDPGGSPNQSSSGSSGTRIVSWTGKDRDHFGDLFRPFQELVPMNVRIAELVNVAQNILGVMQGGSDFAYAGSGVSGSGGFDVENINVYMEEKPNDPNDWLKHLSDQTNSILRRRGIKR